MRVTLRSTMDGCDGGCDKRAPKTRFVLTQEASRRGCRLDASHIGGGRGAPNQAYAVRECPLRGLGHEGTPVERPFHFNHGAMRASSVTEIKVTARRGGDRRRRNISAREHGWGVER